MKFLVFIFLFGFAACLPNKPSDDATLDIVSDIGSSTEEPYTEESDEELQTELGKILREHLGRFVETIKEATDRGKELKTSLLVQAKELREELKRLEIDAGNKAREHYQKIRGKAKDWALELLETLNMKEFNESFHSTETEKILKRILTKIENEATDNEITQYIIEELGNTAIGGFLLNKLKEGREALHEMVEIMLKAMKVYGRSVMGIYKNIREYMTDLRGDLNERFANFMEWLNGVYSKGKDAALDRIDSIKDVAHKFINQAKNVRKEVVEEALAFFYPYQNDLGELWEDIKKIIKETVAQEAVNY